MVCQEETPNSSLLWTSDLSQDYMSFTTTTTTTQKVAGMMAFADITTEFVGDIQVCEEGGDMTSIVTHKDGSCVDGLSRTTTFRCLTVAYNPKFFASVSYPKSYHPPKTETENQKVNSNDTYSLSADFFL